MDKPAAASISRLQALRARLRPKGLGSDALRVLVWTSLGFAGSQAMRLGGNLLMTRLLLPEYFGVMAIVTAVLVGLQMFSDIGLGPGIVRSSRHGSEDLLNTGWTLQLLRGVLLQLACCLAALPLAHFYNEPSLALLLPVSGVALLITSLAPMQVYTLQRTLSVGRLVGIDLAAQALALMAMLIASRFYHSVWILVLGAVAAAAVKTSVQWLLLPVHRHKLALISRDVQELARFGGWIFVSTLLTFGASSAGSLVLGKLATLEKVGLFAIALALAKVPEMFYDQICSRVLYPVYANLLAKQQGDPVGRILQIRAAIVAGFVPAICLVALFAQPIVRTLFDVRYHGAAWIFQALLLGLVPAVISSTMPYLIARGSSVLSAGFQAARLTGFAVLVSIGYQVGGEDGAILGIAFVPSLLYLVDYGIQRANGLSDFRVDAVALTIWAATGAAVWSRHA